MGFSWRRRSDMRTCENVGRSLQTYLDGEIDELRARKIARHLDTCLRCGLAADTYMEIKRALRRRGASIPRDALDRLRAFCGQLASNPGLTSDDDPAGA